MIFDLGSFMLGGLFAITLVLVVLFLFWRTDKKRDAEILSGYRKVVDALKKEEQEE